MNKIVFWSLTVAVAGFLFGFDTAVISGADQPIQKLWGTTPFEHGFLVMSSALWGTVIGAVFGNIPCERLGRKPTLVMLGVLYLLSALGSALATDPVTFGILRFIGGLGVGISSIAVPAYIAEIAPANYRGRLVAIYQFQIVFGILIAFLSNYLLSGGDLQDWRLMLGVEAIPALIYLLMIIKAPESPRWLIVKRNNLSRARQILESLGAQQIDEVINRISAESQQQFQDRLFNRDYWFPVTLAFVLAAFNQLSGINFIIYYAPRVFELAGLTASSSLLSTAGIGLVNLVATMLGLYLIDKAGRKKLLIIGSIGYLVSLCVVTWAFAANLSGITVVLFIFLFIAAHAVGQGAVIWVFIAEIFPTRVRAKGQSLGAGTHWVFAALITLFMPVILSAFSAQIVFGFFAIMMLLQLIFVLTVLPETKLKELEEISGEVVLEGGHA